jgi:hypothetical protein
VIARAFPPLLPQRADAEQAIVEAACDRLLDEVLQALPVVPGRGRRLGQPAHRWRAARVRVHAEHDLVDDFERWLASCA